MLMCASYAEVALSQAPAKEWKFTRIVALPSDNEIPTLSQRDNWMEILPEKPSPTPWASLFSKRRPFNAKRVFQSEAAALRNARALRNRLQLAGWLEAEVQTSWVPARGGVFLELAMQCGPRWTIDSVLADVKGSGLSEKRILKHAALEPGAPFSQQGLRAARERIALGVQQDGHVTFHSGHISFQADTLGATSKEGVTLHILCAPRDANDDDALRQPFVNGSFTHPKVHLGQVTWNGALPSSKAFAGGLRPEVWSHLGQPQSGDVYNPALMKAMYNRLSRVRSVERVQMSNTFRWDTVERHGASPRKLALMDVDYTVVQKPSHDLGIELDLVRNDARYGPRLSTTLQHRNPKGWGAENAWEVAFGYVAVAPFSTLSSATFLNAGEWTLSWEKNQIGILPLPLTLFRPSNEPQTTLDAGWDREVWPEFTRSQFHVQHDYSLVENASRQAKWRWSPAEVSFVNLTNRDASFEQWLLAQENPLVQARFNNHLTLGSALAWESDWSLGGWGGRVATEASWSGGLAQRLAEAWAPSDAFDEASGAWLITSNVPLVQHQRILVNLSGQRSASSRPRLTAAAHVLLGFANAGKNTPSLPLEQAFFSGGANGIRGWRLRTLGPGNTQLVEGIGSIAGVGDIRVDVQLEERLTLNDLWQLALFTDLGNVWLHGEEVSKEATWDFNGFGWSAGLGIRFDLGFFLLRLDGALRLHDPGLTAGSRWVGQGPAKGALHLGLGLPF